MPFSINIPVLPATARTLTHPELQVPIPIHFTILFLCYCLLSLMTIVIAMIGGARERETNEACHNCLSSVLGNKSASRKFEPTNMWFQVLGPYSPAIFKNGLISIILYI